MATLTKIIVSILLSLLLLSCNFDLNFGVKGNGDVTTTNRELNESFNAISANEGLDVYITQGDSESVRVQADSNLQDIIITEVKDGVLKIHTADNISYAATKKVMVSFKSVDKISASSGSDIISTNTITADDLKVYTSSGSDAKLEVDVEHLICDSSSGSDIKISGATNTLEASASSGSDIKAGELKAISTVAKANSGADITVNTSKKLTASANSGGDIKYYGDPENVEKNEGPSGGITKR